MDEYGRIPNKTRKIRATKPKVTGPFTRSSGSDFTPGRGYDFGTTVERIGEEYRTVEREDDRPRFIPKVTVTGYGLPCAGCGITRPIAATDGGECEYCGTVYAPTPGARVYVES